MSSTSKFRIKMGEIEVEYEGSDEFLKKEIPELLAAVSKLHKEAGSVLRVSLPPKDNGRKASADLTGTTATIAAKLQVKSGTDLILAAAAQLTFVEGTDSFDVQTLRTACRAGKSYWKKSYGNNFTKYLAQLVGDGSLNEISSGVYALNSKKSQELGPKLASD